MAGGGVAVNMANCSGSGVVAGTGVGVVLGVSEALGVGVAGGLGSGVDLISAAVGLVAVSRPRWREKNDASRVWMKGRSFPSCVGSGIAGSRQLARRDGVGVRFESLAPSASPPISLDGVRFHELRILRPTGGGVAERSTIVSSTGFVFHRSARAKAPPKAASENADHEVEKKRDQNRPQDFRFLS